MAKPKGSPKTGGRLAGTPNRRTVEVLETLRAAGFSAEMPFLYWARVLRAGLAPRTAKAEKFLIGHDESGAPIWDRPSPAMMQDAARELAAYTAPKLKAIELSGANGEPLEVRLLNLEQLPASGIGVKGGAG